ncbi:MAG TPA: cation:proton antiporter, partial [bacterium]|nr:cation:proton antiporter [bacterium]
MMHAFLNNLAMVLVVAAATTVLCQRFKLPVVFGYLLAGMIVGPHLPIPLVADPETVAMLAELGVILLMFAIGLEFSLGRLLRLGLVAGFTALIEIGISFWLGDLAARAAGLSSTAALFVGGALCISSTTIIARVFTERPPDRALRDRVFGVLLIEDLVAVLLLAVLTAVAAGHGLSWREITVVSGKLGAFLLALILGGLLLVPRFFRTIHRLGRAETLLVAGVGTCFGMAVLAQRFGYSVALGGFLAGMLIAETGRGAELERLVQPLRDLFAAIFFVAVGMMIVPAAVLAHWQLVLALTALVITAKFAGLTVGVFLTGGGLRLAVRAGMTMGQIGEFSFIIAGVGRAAGLLDDGWYSVIVAVSALTTFLTPLTVARAERVAGYIDRCLPTPVQNYLALYASWLGASNTPAGLVARSRRMAGLVALDALALAALLIGGALAWPTLTGTVQAMGVGALMARTLPAVLLGGLAAMFVLVIAVNSKKL